MAAEALMAFRNGEKSDQAFVGAVLLADGLHSLRDLRGFLTGLGRAGGKRG